MAENKTRPTNLSPTKFINGLDSLQRRKDCRALMKLMKEATGKAGKMWGDSIIGFDTYHYKYASGREGDFFITGFSPRKRDLTLYIMPGFAGYEDLLQRLGKYKTGKSCLYIKNLESVDIKVLKKIITSSVMEMRKRYPPDGQVERLSKPSRGNP